MDICYFHILNLLAKDLEISDIKNNILRIMKYFRNTHLPNAYYKRSCGKSLITPFNVMWNTMLDCIEVYLNKWYVFMHIC